MAGLFSLKAHSIHNAVGIQLTDDLDLPDTLHFCKLMTSILALKHGHYYFD